MPRVAFCLAALLSLALAPGCKRGDARLRGQPLPPPPGPEAAPLRLDPGERAGRVRFIALGDTGSGAAGQYRVGRAIEKACESLGCDFLLLLGDNIYGSGPGSPDDPAFESSFERPYERVDRPFFVALGNHDYAAFASFWPEKADFEVLYSERSSRWTMPARYYHFTRGNAEFIALDTTRAFYGRDGAQEEAVRAWTGRSTATWKIAFGHHPYLSNGKHGDAGSYDGALGHLPIAGGGGVKRMLETTVCGKVDLYLAGHDHNQQWLEETCLGTELAVSGAGATPSALRGRHPSRFQSSAAGFLHVAIEGPALRATFLGDEAQVEASRELRKGSGGASGGP